MTSPARGARRDGRSLKTSDVEVAIARRDALFTMLATEGEDVPERPPRRRRPTDQEPPMLRVAFLTKLVRVVELPSIESTAALAAAPWIESDW